MIHTALLLVAVLPAPPTPTPMPAAPSSAVVIGSAIGSGIGAAGGLLASGIYLGGQASGSFPLLPLGGFELAAAPPLFSAAGATLGAILTGGDASDVGVAALGGAVGGAAGELVGAGAALATFLAVAIVAYSLPTDSHDGLKELGTAWLSGIGAGCVATVAVAAAGPPVALLTLE